VEVYPKGRTSLLAMPASETFASISWPAKENNDPSAGANQFRLMATGGQLGGVEWRQGGIQD